MDETLTGHLNKTLDERPIVIFGSVRSGTTMFRLMMGAHPDLVEIGENRYLVDFLNNPNGDDLSYNVAGLSKERVFRMRNLVLENSLDGPAQLASMLKQLKNGRTGPKVLTFHSDAKVIDRLFPDARYIHIFRDPRDVASSVLHLGWAGNVYYAADQWLTTETDWDGFVKTLSADRYTEIRYEDLVSNPEDHLENICNFLGIEFDTSMLTYDEKSTYSKPDSNLLLRWKKNLSFWQIKQIEAKCRRVMQARGYSCVTGADQTIGGLGQLYLRIDNKIRKTAFAISFFGLRDYGLEKIYRLPGFKNRHTDVSLRMQETVNRSLK